jgi:hypothetical protein
MCATRQIAFLEPDIAEHRRGDRDMLGLTPVGGACERQLIVAPRQVFHPTRGHEWDREKRLRSRPPERHDVRVTRPSDQGVLRPHYRRMHPVSRFHGPATSHHDVQIVLIHRPAI